MTPADTPDMVLVPRKADNTWIAALAESLSADKDPDAVGALAWNLSLYHRRLTDRCAKTLSASPLGASGEGALAPLAPTEQAGGPVVGLSNRVANFVRDYEFRGESDYTPSDNERALIEDAIHGFIAEAPILDPALVRDWIERVADGSMSDDDALSALSAPSTTSTAEQVGRYITFSPSGDEGNAVVSPDAPAEGVYWTLIGSGPDLDQNALAAEIVRRLNAPNPPGEGEAPVAWRVDGMTADGEPVFVTDAADLHDEAVWSPGVTVKALFTRPTPATPEGLREVIRKVGRWVQNGMEDQSSDTPSREALRRDLTTILSALQPQAQPAAIPPESER